VATAQSRYGDSNSQKDYDRERYYCEDKIWLLTAELILGFKARLAFHVDG
jgi:hypothetical protein